MNSINMLAWRQSFTQSGLLAQECLSFSHCGIKVWYYNVKKEQRPKKNTYQQLNLSRQHRLCNSRQLLRVSLASRLDCQFYCLTEHCQMMPTTSLHSAAHPPRSFPISQNYRPTVSGVPLSRAPAEPSYVALFLQHICSGILACWVGTECCSQCTTVTISGLINYRKWQDRCREIVKSFCSTSCVCWCPAAWTEQHRDTCPTWQRLPAVPHMSAPFSVNFWCRGTTNSSCIQKTVHLPLQVQERS